MQALITHTKQFLCDEDGATITIIHVAQGPGSTQEAESVRAEVERYFLRHFPGRILPASPAGSTQTPESSADERRVYIALLPA